MITMNAWTSIMAFSREMVERFAEDGQVVDWEAFSTLNELPASDLIGPVSFMLEERSAAIFDVSFTIGVSTFDDTSLFRHRKIVAQIFEELRPGKRLTVYDAETSLPYSWMKLVDGTTLAPISNAQTRSFQFVSVQCLLDPNAGSKD